MFCSIMDIYLRSHASNLCWMAFQNCCAGRTKSIVPREMNIRVFVGQHDGFDLLFLFEGAYHGALSDFEVAIHPLLDALDEIGG